jgi:hypothetical protein
MTIQHKLRALRLQLAILDRRASNPRTDARIATEAAIERDELLERIADIEEKMQSAAK